MATAPQLDLRQSQSLVMTPQLQQAIKLLQYSSQELNEFIDQELGQNPLLERSESQDEERPIARTIDQYDADNGQTNANDQDDYSRDSADYLKQTELGSDYAQTPLDSDYQNDYDGDIAGAGAIATGSDTGGMTEMGGSVRSQIGDGDSFDPLEQSTQIPTLRDHLTEQLGTAFSNGQERAIGQYLVDLLEPTGWLPISLEEIAENLGVPSKQIEAVLTICQQFEPAGVFARNLKECLALQLIDKNRYDPAMQRLLDHLELVAKRDWTRLLRICQVNREDLGDMIRELKALDPKPGLQYDGGSLAISEPDILVKTDPKGQFVLELNPNNLHRLIVNDALYTKVVGSDHSDKQTRDYLVEHRQNANWLVKSLRQRAETILKVSEALVRQQSGFFHFGVSYLRPLVLREIAAETGLHESTISRVTTNKFLSCSRGIFELKYFFTPTIAGSDGDGHSAEAVRYRIKTLIDEEAPDKILSDDRLVKILKEEGVELARRTVAKYREGMNIPSSVQRRRQKQAEKI